MTERGVRQFGAGERDGHDDLALATALACWRAKRDERTIGDCSAGRLI
jgi:hypothetical protein